MENKNYNLKYKNINIDVINLVKKAILEDRFFKKEDAEKLIYLKMMLIKLNNIYNLATNLDLTTEKTDGYYNTLNRTIYLKKLSLLTFLHEFKHSIQHQKGLNNNEEIARGYSCSLFYLASPFHYNRAIEKGIIFFA